MARPVWTPTDAQRRQAETMAAYGIPEADIARVLGVSKPTLRKHCGTELDQGDSPIFQAPTLTSNRNDVDHTSEKPACKSATKLFLGTLRSFFTLSKRKGTPPSFKLKR